MTPEEALETMCRRCINNEHCNGTGCEPKKILSTLITSEPKTSLFNKEEIKY